MFRPPFSRFARPAGLPGPVLRIGAWLALALALVIIASWALTRYYLWPELNRWRPEIEVALTDALGQPVRIGALVPGFDGFRPRLEISELRVGGAEGGSALLIPRIDATLSWRSAVVGEPRFVAIRMSGAKLAVARTAERRWTVAGIEFDADAGNGTAARWILGQPLIRIEASGVAYEDRLAGASANLALQELQLESVGQRHKLRVLADSPELGSLQLALDIQRAAGAPALEWRGASAAVQGVVERLEWSLLRRFVADAPGAEAAIARFENVRGAIRGKLEIAAGKPVRAQADFELSDLRVAGEAATSSVTWELAQLSGDLRARWDQQGNLVMDLAAGRVNAGADVTLGLAGKDNQMRFDAAGTPVAVRLGLDGFDVGNALRLARTLPWLAAAGGERLRQAQGSGRIDGLVLQWEADADASRYGLDFAFSDLALRSDAAADSRWPSFAGLSGTVRMTHKGGEARIEGKGSRLTFPGVFAEPEIALDTLDARTRWTIGPAATAGSPAPIDVEIERLRFASADAAGDLRGRYRSGGKGPGVVDLTGTIDRAEARRVARYLPLNVGPAVPEWLSLAIGSGRASAGSFRLRGDLADFPYRDPTTGEFKVSARVSDATLAYSPGWPAIERFEGRIAFERAGMLITMKSGAVFGARLGETTARIADFADPMLRVEGSAEGPAQAMVRFVNESPLRNRIDDFTGETLIDGEAKLELRLAIPLRDVAPVRVNGAVLLAGNDVRLDRTLPKFERVRGRLEFTEERLALRALSARLLGGPLLVDGETTGPGRFVLRASGTIGSDGLRQLVDNPVTRRLAGSANYQANIDVNRHSARVRIDSDLAGLASTLPAPFAKTAGERWALRIDTVPLAPTDPNQRPVSDRIEVRLRDDIRLEVARERDPVSQKMRVRSAVVALNSASVLPTEGLRVAVQADEIDLDVWNALLRDASGPVEPASATAALASDFTEGFVLLPESVSVVARRVRLAHKVLDDVVLGATRLSGFWNANLSSRQITGFFNWRAAPTDQLAGSLTARFTRLEIPPDRIGEFESLLDAEPQALPALDIVADEFVLGATRMGRMELRAMNTRTSSGAAWKLERLRIEHPGATFLASGSWAPPQTKSRATSLDFQLELRDSGLALEAHGVVGALKGGPGRIDGKVQWVGSPLAIDYPSLRGDLTLAIGKGQFLKTDPGVAKLIGVLSLQALPRRLTLDFRDVFAKGFAFDEIRGDVSIRGGVARTENLGMKGVGAQVKIQGSADIANETQNLRVQIRPELNAGVASLAYAAINPVVGIGTFVAQMVLSGPLQEIFASEYQVDGSWSDPHVVAVPSTGKGAAVR